MSIIKGDFLVKYDIVEPIQDYNINCFKQIGLEDPFPNDHETLTGSNNYNVFHAFDPCISVYPETRMMKKHSPVCLYIPRREIMLKLMRASIGVYNESELWIYSQNLDLEFKTWK